jgi:hypothetical protein
MFKKILLLFFVLVIYIFLYCHIANNNYNNYRKKNIKNPIVVHQPNFELKFEKVPPGIQTIFDEPDVMRNVNINKLSIYYTVWKYGSLVSDVDKIRKSLIGVVDFQNNQLPPEIYHSSIVLEESDTSEFIYLIEFSYDEGMSIFKLIRKFCVCNNPRLNYIKPFKNTKDDDIFLMISSVKLKSPSILELVSLMLYRMSNNDNEKIVDKIYKYDTFKFNCQLFISKAIISIIDYVEESDKERLLTVLNSCIQDPRIILKSFLGWKESFASNLFIINQLDKIVTYLNI